MSHCKRLGGLVLGVGLILPAGCASNRTTDTAHWQMGEPLLLVAQEPAKLAFPPASSHTVDVRSTYRNDLPGTLHYEPNRDYTLDAAGQLQRTRGSRIPDYGTNILYGKEDFNHGQFPGYGNRPFFVYVDYAHREAWTPPAVKGELGADRLPRTKRKLADGDHVRIVAFGDSITAGGEASEPGLIFWQRWADSLGRKYPKANVEAINGATGGDTTVQGLERLETKVVQQQPDLVLIGFGMNDHNIPGYGVPLEKFSANLRAMVDRVREKTGAELVLFSAFPPNSKWHFGSHSMGAYAAATEQVAREKQCAFADVYGVWMSIASKKKPEDLLANNINHPNDFGHWLYFKAFEALGL